MPANKIQVKGEIIAFLKVMSGEKMKEGPIKNFLDNFKNTEVAEFKKLSEDDIEGTELKETLDDMNQKDIELKNLPRPWKQISLFPGESFEYVQYIKVSGKDAEWFVVNFNKVRAFRIKMDLSYYGILPKVGRPYHSHLIVAYENNSLLPYESESR